MKKMLIYPILILVSGGLIYLSGCGSNSGDLKSKVVIARINNYILTDEDFKNEAGSKKTARRFSKDGKVSRKLVLNEMIEKQVLLQEAQRQNFDKDSLFMKEIEHYWEQALLKLLLKKKTGELSRNISVTDDEIKKEYEIMLRDDGPEIGALEQIAPEIKGDLRQRKMQEALDAWIIELVRKARIDRYEDNLEKVDLGE